MKYNFEQRFFERITHPKIVTWNMAIIYTITIISVRSRVQQHKLERFTVYMIFSSYITVLIKGIY